MGRYIDYADVTKDLAEQLDTSIYTQAVVDAYIAFAEDQIDKITNKDQSWISRAITETKDGDGTSTIVLDFYPITVITSVTVDDVVIAAADRWDYEELGYITLKEGVVSNSAVKQNIVVAYTAGYADQASIPDYIKEAALLFVEEQIAAKSAGVDSTKETDKWGIDDFTIEKSTSNSESKGFMQISALLRERINKLATMDITII